MYPSLISYVRHTCLLPFFHAESKGDDEEEEEEEEEDDDDDDDE